MAENDLSPENRDMTPPPVTTGDATNDDGQMANDQQREVDQKAAAGAAVDVTKNIDGTDPAASTETTPTDDLDAANGTPSTDDPAQQDQNIDVDLPKEEVAADGKEASEEISPDAPDEELFPDAKPMFNFGGWGGSADVAPEQTAAPAVDFAAAEKEEAIKWMTIEAAREGDIIGAATSVRTHLEMDFEGATEATINAAGKTGVDRDGHSVDEIIKETSETVLTPPADDKGGSIYATADYIEAEEAAEADLGSLSPPQTFGEIMEEIGTGIGFD